MGADKARPDLVIEVVITSGGIDKLEAYKRLEIREVWFLGKNRMFLYVLGESGYKPMTRSQLFPALDIDLLVRCVNMANHVEAIGEFNRAIP